MMPNTSVRPAASRNNSSPNCNPFRNCSTTSSMKALGGIEHRTAKHVPKELVGWGERSDTHHAFVEIADGFRFAQPILRLIIKQRMRERQDAVLDDSASTHSDICRGSDPDRP